MATATSSRSFRATIWAPFSSMPASIVLCCTWIAIVAIIGLTARWSAPFDYLSQDPLARFARPFLSAGHLFGTDYLGRDVVSNLLVATQTTLTIALVGSVICALLGTSLGFLAAHFGGWVDNAIMGFADAMASVPFIVIALGVLAVFGSSPLLFVFLVGVFNWWRYTRLTRALVISANEEGYAEAARIVGVPPLRLYLRHMLPNIAGPLIVQFTVNFPEIILLESGLSFLGLGIQPPATSLGLMVADGRNYLAIAWWLVAFPGAVIVLTTLSISLLGDFLRDRFDARLR
ncbi:MULTISPECIES: ABC transporter permease [Rhizobium/Agrobacterium group]|uniref:TM component of ABC transporter of agrocinopine n=1 Tax=Agrobacterium tumefaciens TaxID=358 RepID=K7WT33_AGRTU|nr:MULTISPECIES: ABC transporter permease [Rhizobium/Agrobacterium group]AFX65642.1 TM component of ABC transporter of agrocinopine [Agrobacterium radiobacter]KEA02980.1 peptide ABC transporter permease [Rhizobium rhizogenes]NTI39029.1 ABC transporter permease [Rhizobium rhizogenes]NTI85213.1 ABC transporter permease [Rhizobium rhizogenes]NTJ27399.1 ABC transporter permease [Rhizobium rhizogenes]